AHVEAAHPLVAHDRTPAPELAGALARSVADSGLFYEAHLARWSREAYPAAALAREPQAQWPVTAAGGPADPDGAPPAPLPDGAVALLTRQLDALDARQVVWSGLVWPGQPATIAFDENVGHARDDAAEDAGGAAPRTWRTRIALDLPSLGRVEATIALAGATLHVRLATAQDDSAARLQAARADLAEALAPSRLALDGFVVDLNAPVGAASGARAAASAAGMANGATRS
ncbi:MAG TPA: flagellar hook-length control protein FliK, partial [Casimicrobiaceae bacterium]|nr:flagellar hook-length control protein FliK [Casimicrobiaceae bacterium]